MRSSGRVDGPVPLDALGAFEWYESHGLANVRQKVDLATAQAHSGGKAAANPLHQE